MRSVHGLPISSSLAERQSTEAYAGTSPRARSERTVSATVSSMDRSGWPTSAIPELLSERRRISRKGSVSRKDLLKRLTT